MHNHKILNIACPDTAFQALLNRELGICKILAQVLINRGIKDIAQAQAFLNTKLDQLLDPYSLSDMHKAVGLIKKIALHKKKVMIFGDYDVDGITSLALLKATLSKLGLEATHYLPHRIKEGYGLNKNVIDIAKQKKINLIITVDCGISNYKEIKELRRHNIEVIVTDHHEPINSNLVPASCIINPKLKDSSYKYRDLAGVGVAYKLCQALTSDFLVEDLDLVSLGTISDLAPLTGENRIIAKQGLEQLSRTKKIGLKALMKNSGIKNKKMTTYFIYYMLGPRINASGRMDTAEVALNLLLTQTQLEAERLASLIEAYNLRRRKIEGEVLKEAEGLIEKEVNFKEHKIIVLAKEAWHEGVLGIVASKLADRFYRPVIVISKGATLCRGSCRSIKNVHLFKLLSECKSLLKSFGGHSRACGLVIAKDNIGDFKNQINRLAYENLAFEDLLPSINIDMELKLSDLNEQLLNELEILEPFGVGNPQPLFYTRNLILKGAVQVLGRDTLKFWVSDGHITYQVIGFGMSEFKDNLINADYFDLVYSLRIDDWEGEESVLLEAKEIFFR